MNIRAFADRKFFTREELAQQKATKDKALDTVAKFNMLSGARKEEQEAKQ